MCYTRRPRSIRQNKTDTKFIESNHDTKTGNLKSCVTFGDRFCHPNEIEMRVNNQFNILDRWKQVILKTLVLLDPGQLNRDVPYFWYLRNYFIYIFVFFYLLHFRNSSKCYIHWIIIYLMKNNIKMPLQPGLIDTEMLF